MTQTIRLDTLLPWIAAIIGGSMFFLGYAGFDQYYLNWICLVPVLWAIRKQSPGRAFLLGWVAGIAGHTGGFYWIIHMLQVFAGLPFGLAILGLLAIAAANGMVFAVWAWATRIITRDTGWSVVWVSPVLLTAMEMCWPEIFPNYLGASQYKLIYLTQIADLTGILGVTFLIAYLNSALYAVLEQWFADKRFDWRNTAACILVLTAVLIYGGVRIHRLDQLAATAEKLSIGMVQTNIGAGDKRNNPSANLREHQEMSKALLKSRPLDLIVWPESIYSLTLQSGQERLSTELTGNLATPVMFGAAVHLEQGKNFSTYNAGLLVNAEGKLLGRYDKMLLVPFGEYVPFGKTFPQLYDLMPAVGRFSPGKRTEPLHLGRHLLSVSICYEDIFPGQIRLLMRGGDDQRIPDLMFNLTNDSWYGKTIQPVEHLALASFRSIEHRRSLVRATNTGVSAFVDPVGRLVRQSGIWTQEVLADRVPIMQGHTLYALLGDWIGWICVVLSIVAIGQTTAVSGKAPTHTPLRRP